MIPAPCRAVSPNVFHSPTMVSATFMARLPFFCLFNCADFYSCFFRFYMSSDIAKDLFESLTLLDFNSYKGITSFVSSNLSPTWDLLGSWGGLRPFFAVDSTLHLLFLQHTSIARSIRFVLFLGDVMSQVFFVYECLTLFHYHGKGLTIVAPAPVNPKYFSAQRWIV